MLTAMRCALTQGPRRGAPEQARQLRAGDGGMSTRPQRERPVLTHIWGRTASQDTKGREYEVCKTKQTRNSLLYHSPEERREMRGGRQDAG